MNEKQHNYNQERLLASAEQSILHYQDKPERADLLKSAMRLKASCEKSLRIGNSYFPTNRATTFNEFGSPLNNGYAKGII